MKARSIALVAVVAAAQLAAVGCVILPRRAVPKTTGAVTLAGLTAPVELLRTAGLPGVLDLSAPYRKDMPFVLTDEELGLGEPEANNDRGELRVAGMSLPWMLGREDSRGSNSWVVSGERTTTGKPILAVDTHLGVQIPSIWYEMGLHTVDENGQPLDSEPGHFQVRGFTFPGYRGVIIGHNSTIAWGITDFGDDVEDFYLEKINPSNPSQYLAGGAWQDMEITPERIDIQGQDEPYVYLVRATRHGPILSDRGGFKPLEGYSYAPEGEFPDNLELSAVALRWSALDAGQLWMCFLRLNRAKSFAEFREAWRYFDGPVLNVTYADTDGNIGYQAAGRIPIRAVGEGRIPMPGWTEEFEWTDYIPYDKLPSVLNPTKGYIVTSNNPVASPNFPYDLGTSYAYGYRARRIVEAIDGDPDKVSVDDVKRLQADVTDTAAKEIVRYLDGLDLGAERISELPKEKEPLGKKDQKEKAKLDSQVKEALEPARKRLLAWDGQASVKSSAAALYGFFFLALTRETFEDQYPYERWTKASQSRMEYALYYLLEDPTNAWWDDVRSPDVTETRDDILVRALRKGVRDGIERLGSKLEKWEWGKVHTTGFRNASLGESGIKLIEGIFNRGPVATNGSTDTVSAAAWKKDEPFEVNHVVTNRQIIDLSDIGAGLMVHAPGQSGHPGSRHYDDLIEPWPRFKYHPSLFRRPDVQANQQARLILRPASVP